MTVWVWVTYLVSGPSPWKKPLPVYISNPAPERAETQALSASVQSSLSFFLPQFIYLLTHYSPTTGRISHVHGCPATHPHTHTHTHTSWTLTNTLIHHLTHIMLCHCRPVLLNHSCKHHRPLLLDLPLSFFPSHVFSLLSICYLFLVPLSISPSSPFSNFLLCSPAFFPGIETWPVVSLA